MARDVARHLGAAHRMADEGRVMQVERIRQLRVVIGEGVKVVAEVRPGAIETPAPEDWVRQGPRF